LAFGKAKVPPRPFCAIPRPPLIGPFKVIVPPLFVTAKSAFKAPVPVMVKLKPPLMVDATFTVKLLGTALNVALACKVPPLKIKVPAVPIAVLVPSDKVPAFTVVLRL